jgi:hypothetical protein
VLLIGTLSRGAWGSMNMSVADGGDILTIDDQGFTCCGLILPFDGRGRHDPFAGIIQIKFI